MSLLPSRANVTPSPDDAVVLDLATADDAMAVLASGTARTILTKLYERPHTAPELRESVGTSLQNVHYHLDRLESTGLIEPAGVGYSEKGTEMAVYTPAREAIVLVAGEAAERSRLRELLRRAIGAIALVAGTTLAFDALLGWIGGSSQADVQMTVARESPAGGTQLTHLVTDPTVAFALGGLVGLAALAVWLGIRSH